MGAVQATIYCFAFIVGLLATAVPWGGWLLGGLGAIATIAVPRLWRSPLPRITWVVAGAIGLLATCYFQLRLPHPPAHDISRLLTPQDGAVNVLVEGQVTSLPRITRSGKAQFWLEALAIAPIGDRQPITGKVYTTVPPEQAKSLHPGQRVQVAGVLYLPKPAANPGGFDFQQYLAQDHSFAGLRGDQVTLQQEATGWGLWRIQQRIVEAQQQGAGTPAGALISAMVLGGRAVNLPYDVKDAFVRVGLAHALAASGFQTTLILGVVLALTRRYSAKLQLLLGTLALVGFVGLAGGQPAVLRAAIMGFGGLVAIALNRQVRPLGALLLTGVLLLLVNPLWIWDLGFQLSFLATLGLLVTAAPVARRCDWLPTAIASAIAVPIAAYVWTLPLQLGAFGVLSPYSIPANLATTLLVSGISLGGMASAIAALIWMPAGSALAWVLKSPTQALIAIVHGFGQLPGNGWAMGTISVALVLVLYGLLGLCSWHRWWRTRWQLTLGVAVLLVSLPVLGSATATQVTILATTHEPALVLRDRGRVLVFGGSEAQTVQSTLMPYFQKAGINQIDWAIAPDARSAEQWATAAQTVSVRYLLQPPTMPVRFQSSAAEPPVARGTQLNVLSWGLHQTAKVGTAEITLLNLDPAIAQLHLQGQTWLWLGKLNPDRQLAGLANVQLPQADVLWWTGKSIWPAVVQRVQPRMAIASSPDIDPETERWFQQHQIPLYVTGREGAMQWTAATGFSPYSDGFGGE
jgi:competence protein ComEC